MRARLVGSIVALICAFTEAAETKTAFSGEKKLNNLVSDLLEVAPVANPNKPLTFSRSTDGWVFISATCKGKGTVRVMLDKELGGESAIVHCTEFGPRGEGEEPPDHDEPEAGEVSVGEQLREPAEGGE